jgi:uncharacterized caspase-like protein
VSLSAYAFNQDRVKSATVTQTFMLTPKRRTVKGRAYVISVGVNSYEDEAWDLKFAGADARVSQEILARNLSATKNFNEVVCISLISERGDSGVVSSERLATKKNFKSILEVLAGHLSPASLSAQLSGARRLRKVNPEDLVLITFSSHGYTDKRGTFYLIPFDTGNEVRFGQEGEIRAESLANFISSDELSMWLKDIDAGEIALIVDTCHSAAAVEAGGFKPGPMGSRGMGQLAYDKGIRVLAASQADDVAVEINRLRHGLLTYALMLDGLENDNADLDDDDTITLDEWLAYGAKNVPLLYEKLKFGTSKELMERDLRITSLVAGPSVNKNGFQRPSLFDFRRTKREVQIKKWQE